MLPMQAVSQEIVSRVKSARLSESSSVYYFLTSMDSMKPLADSRNESQSPETQMGGISAELIPLFRILISEPAKEHDFKTCPICEQYGLTEI
jgi:hypothetical protein